MPHKTMKNELGIIWKCVMHVTTYNSIQADVELQIYFIKINNNLDKNLLYVQRLQHNELLQ